MGVFEKILKDFVEKIVGFLEKLWKEFLVQFLKEFLLEFLRIFLKNPSESQEFIGESLRKFLKLVFDKLQKKIVENFQVIFLDISRKSLRNQLRLF